MRLALILLSLLASLSCSHKQRSIASLENDPLPSWNETAIKASIKDYIAKITATGTQDFIPPEDRIATFDNDGTLWPEQPPNEILFSEARAKEKNIKHKPLNQMNQNEVLRFLYSTHTGMTSEVFAEEVDHFFATTIHPRLNVPLKETTYKPQIELIKYLISNGFKIYICSGGTVDFTRQVSQELYSIPKEQVIGTNFYYNYDEDNNALVRMPKIEFINDKKTKAYAIQKIIGKRPVFATGNVKSGGDIYMLRYSQGSKYPNFQLLINHDDADREFSYDEKDGISMIWAKRYNWNILSMKNDWKQIFFESYK